VQYLLTIGRARRREYAFIHIAAVALWVAVFSVLPTDSSGEIADKVPTALGVIAGVGGVLGFCLILTVTARRFHDLGSSGWLILATIIPIVDWVLGFPRPLP